MNFRDTLFVNNEGKLVIGGITAEELACRFGTPLYVFDEAHIRAMCRAFRGGIAEYGNAEILYASKAFSCKEIYRIAHSEGLGCDTVSGGELFTALAAGMPAEKIYMHGNNKTEKELYEAVSAGVNSVVIDSYDEIDLLDRIAEKQNKKQKVLLRLNCGVEAHTHSHIQTARPDSKFGFGISAGYAEHALQKTLAKKHLDLHGFTCHIGSQIFDEDSYYTAATVMLDFIKQTKNKFDFTARELVLGGGFGVWYNDGDPAKKPSDYALILKRICAFVKKECAERALSALRLVFEPGRAIVAEAGLTLYTVGGIRDIEGIVKYISVDGGMFENPRYALYGAKYSAVIANKAAEAPSETVTITGKCCESGDMVASNVRLQKAERGDILAVLTTGAYNYSMASHYNRNFVPPVVSVIDRKAKYIIKPESYEDLVRNDI